MICTDRVPTVSRAHVEKLYHRLRAAAQSSKIADVYRPATLLTSRIVAAPERGLWQAGGPEIDAHRLLHGMNAIRLTILDLRLPIVRPGQLVNPIVPTSNSTPERTAALTLDFSLRTGGSGISATPPSIRRTDAMPTKVAPPNPSPRQVSPERPKEYRVSKSSRAPVITSSTGECPMFVATIRKTPVNLRRGQSEGLKHLLGVYPSTQEFTHTLA